MADGTTIASTPYVQTQIPNLGEEVSQGFHAGVQLAQHEKQLKQQQDQLGIMKQQHQMQAAMKFIDVMDKAGKTKGPAQKALFAIGKQVAPMAGLTNLDPGIFDLVQSGDPDTTNFFNTLSGEFLADPVGFLQKHPEKAQAAYSAMNSDMPGFLSMVQKFHGIHQAGVRSEQEAVGKIFEGTANRQAQKDVATMRDETARRGQDIQVTKSQNETKLKAALGGADILDEQGEIDPAKVIAAAQAVNARKENESAAKVEGQKAKTEETQVKTEELPKTNAEKARHNMATEAETAAYHKGLLAAKKYGLSLSGARLDVAKDRLDRQDHRFILQNLKKDPQTTERLRQFGNLGVALSQIADAKNLTPQQIQEFQQAVRSNLGIKGTGGVDEREKTYINSLGLKAEGWAQFLTGEPAAISKDNNIVKHFQDLAKLERKNIGQILDKRIDTVSAGRGTMYKHRPDLKADLLDQVSAIKAQYATPETTSSAPAKPSFSPGQIQLMLQKGGPAYTRQYLRGKGYADDEITSLGVK